MSTSTIADISDRALEDLRAEIENVPVVHASLKNVVTWISSLFSLLLYALDISTQHISNRLEALSVAPPSATGAPSSIGAAAPTSTAQHHTAAPRGPSRSRCTMCHACGHTATDCTTANPSAMRKRVAWNNRIAKKARTQRAMPALLAAPPSFYYPSPPFLPPHPPPMQYAAMAADSVELHRRSRKSKMFENF
ncbi:hypothetical protein AGABI1DRAFT_126928 [Agaricus bisporus var. burnettii JB137-S8]|uniref:Uncharacterized protein n=1 Tax=Agaricus bisporus var. burnettii (strain JB137-S8 / ATCC MYA-4627 / FGSC 10392) TaxID=597362 RepID=K5XZJ9_AGABU|nr:uncharacterized protein AGABI1DRAFT_126928 [Agaricus bisporus var. burnettii JB137-S8]EKM80875.1 hypothetical protein AGABI1DRAFT_126928 [Agaricus bisporus var. burnettii JB137-S8]